jgi:diguanylate cyclase (GGDEF)-like protein
MRLDGLTLLIAGCFVAAIASALLTTLWLSLRGTRALLWWAAAHIVNSLAAVALAIGLATTSATFALAGGGLIVLSMVLYWIGARVFIHRSPSLPWIGIALAAWLASVVPGLNGDARTSLAVAVAITVGLLVAAAAELWSGREESLVARWPLMATFLLHAVFMAAGVLGIELGTIVADPNPPVGTWFGIIHFERLIFLVAGAVFMVVMARERSEMRTAREAHTDALTGIANRRAFLAAAAHALVPAQPERGPLALVAFDLDHFKAINDRYGHAVGDVVLRSFATTAAALLRTGDLFGRIGGEEFAVLLPGTGMDEAFVVADRIRHAFATSPRVHAGIAIEVSVCAGIASAEDMDLEGLLEAADRALYAAKALGRNRVERARPAKAKPAVRVA